MEIPIRPTLRKKIGSATTDAGWDLLMRMLAWDPAKRITAREAINHRYFKEHPLPREPGLIQTFPSLHEGKKYVAPDGMNFFANFISATQGA